MPDDDQIQIPPKQRAALKAIARCFDRFWSKVEKSSDGCWLWHGARYRGRGSYGKFQINLLAHRLAYLLEKGEIPEGLVLDHLCNNDACVNPEHLEPVTNWENIMRGRGLAAKNARKKTCPVGHIYNRQNTGRSGRRRYCRACKRIKALARYYQTRQTA
jgi:hypothetical protein